MITNSEWEQIIWSFNCMAGYNINNTQYLPKQNVVGLLERYKKEVIKDEDSKP